MTRTFRENATTLIAVALLAAIWLAPVDAEPAQKFEKPPIKLQASKVLPIDMLVGPNHKVKPTVKNDGLINTYELETTYGPLTVESTALLLIRLNELKAIQRLEKMKGTDVYSNALTKSATGPVNTAKALIDDPTGTAKGVASGIGRFFSDVGRSVVSSDPHQANVVETAVGYAAAKRQFAYELGVDPYSDYQPLQERLKEVAWTAVGGGLTTKLAFAAIGGAVGTLVQTTGTAADMKKLVRDKSPAELEKINGKKLKAMGVPKSLVKVFLKNQHLNPQETTLLVGALHGMTDVKDRATFIETAALADSDTVARFLRLRAQMMARYGVVSRAVTRLVEADGVPFLQRKDGIVVGLFPFDHIAWTQALSRKEQRVSQAMEKLKGVTGKELWVGGTVSPMARKALESRGWKVKDRFGDELLRKGR